MWGLFKPLIGVFVAPVTMILLCPILDSTGHKYSAMVFSLFVGCLQLILVRRQNYRRVKLFSRFTGENVGVFLENGDIRYLPFLGFTNRDDALANGDAKPVKLEVHGFYRANEAVSDFVEIPIHKAVQGCLVCLGVYAVIHEGLPKIINLNTADH